MLECMLNIVSLLWHLFQIHDPIVICCWLSGALEHSGSRFRWQGPETLKVMESWVCSSTVFRSFYLLICLVNLCCDAFLSRLFIKKGPYIFTVFYLLLTIIGNKIIQILTHHKHFLFYCVIVSINFLPLMLITFYASIFYMN